MKPELSDRRQFVLQLLVADLLARPGRGPLARPNWPRRARRMPVPPAPALADPDPQPSAAAPRAER